MQLTDTHCHIHEILGAGHVAAKWRDAGKVDADAVIADARKAGVNKLICVGTSVVDSALAVDFAQERSGVWASIGIHPHEAKEVVNDAKALEAFSDLAAKPKVIAVGECGLDYYYNHSPKAKQEQVLRFQIELALAHNLPMIFHVRDAFDDFWPIFDSYPGIRGVIHSFSATSTDVSAIVERGLYIGQNGIMTFTKNAAQLAAAKAIPLNHLLLETDAPFLTPTPYRGSICESKHVRTVAEFLATLRGESLEQLAAATTQNAHDLFELE